MDAWDVPRRNVELSAVMNSFEMDVSTSVHSTDTFLTHFAHFQSTFIDERLIADFLLSSLIIHLVVATMPSTPHHLGSLQVPPTTYHLPPTTFNSALPAVPMAYPIKAWYLHPPLTKVTLIHYHPAVAVDEGTHDSD
ncbi:hypothetical protein F5Y18DRAFT_425217 [Xylariaceae sp. FL1019]|nr:hypothetical protein F5Y18DRAFT_425217 [Xylariaceae sp. FL1019]